jgi:hypothetical protein
MQSEEQKVHLPKLDIEGDNWVMYRDRLLWTMKQFSMKDHIANDSPPAAYTAKGTVRGLASADRWERKEHLIRTALGNSMPDKAFNQIKDTESVKEAWDILRSVYEDHMAALVSDCMKAFRNTKCLEGGNIRTHFHQLAVLRDQLTLLGQTITDRDYLDTLLTSIPRSFEGSISSLNGTSFLTKTKITADSFRAFLLDEYERHILMEKEDAKAGKKEGKDGKDEAFAADSTKKKDKDKRKVECHNCHKKGHMKADCWAKGGGREGQGPRQRGRASDSAASALAAKDKDAIKAWVVIDRMDLEESWAAIEEVSGPEDFRLTTAAAARHTLAQAGRVRGSAPELYDSGASRHMLPLRNRFVTYQEILPRPITVADKRVFYAIGTGDIIIDIPNGESSTPIRLKEALHAPDMGATIVSISRIIKAGFSICFKAQSCKIKDLCDKVIGVIPASDNGLYKVNRVYAAIMAPEHVDLVVMH